MAARLNLDRENAPPPKWSLIALFIFGTLALGTLLVIIRFNPNPSPTSWFVQLTVLALAGGCIAALLPGAIRFEVHGLIKAGGALAVFALIFFYGVKVSGLKLISPDENLTGDWNYTCVAEDPSHPNYSHGGVAHIDMRMTDYGPQWHLSGTRKWETRNGQKANLPDWHWDTDWAAVTSNHEIKYTYKVTAQIGVIYGFADGTITEGNNGKPASVSGNFWQEPPVDPMYGSYVFTRQ